jgi:hypothetical protein
MVQMLEVRCCCEPEKLLGYLTADSDWQSVRYYDPDYQRSYKKDSIEMPKIFSLPIRTFYNRGRYYQAIDAHGITIEQLRKIPGFQEAGDQL